MEYKEKKCLQDLDLIGIFSVKHVFEPVHIDTSCNRKFHIN